MAASFTCSCQGVPAIAGLRQSVWRKADAHFGIDDLFDYRRVCSGIKFVDVVYQLGSLVTQKPSVSKS